MTEFCWEIVKVDETPSRIQWTGTSCPGERNCYDEDCPDYKERIRERLDEDRARLGTLRQQ
ncbi:MAG: hypothetical protein HYY76_00580 [Acidobacteria bacterium]|nr:hypothetical protein [Acidobacteriota bacterium]